MVNICAFYRRDSKYKDFFDELNIKLTHESFKELDSFLLNHQRQRINLCIDNPYSLIEESNLKGFLSLQNRSNLYFRINKTNTDQIEDQIQEVLQQNDLKYYYTEVASDWDVFNGLMSQKITDIFVGNQLGFELDKVAAAAKKHKVRIRVYPNLAQTLWLKNPNLVTYFFVRPEDAITYSEYVDCFEFFEMPDLFPIDTDFLYEIYKFRKAWNGELGLIITGLGDESIDNRTLDEQWGISRVKCGKNCAKDERCKICYHLIEMSEKMNEKEIMMNKFLLKK